ncbi:type IV pilus modification protein PilV [Permianibacter sp. IMCC34836]|uniref:type IV pilus modification protein PilV n=1 Tax=Permianibacter fluminis TaxID=2738515 RepID=UPI0015549466|nr:type IV pilus modification protein PilV [Permianibacter fluminis]NQD37694.1 type IV pilus modification protein PilV [Permianibacter fluminis]
MQKHSTLRQTGFSMIEILIAVLVLAIGLLGVAALQLASMNGSQEGYARSQATAIAEDLASRVRAGRQQAASLANWGTNGITARTALQEYVAQYSANSPYQCGTFDAPTVPDVWCRPDELAGEAGQVCSSAEQTAFEIWETCNQAQRLLPGGTVYAATNSMRVTIAVAWQAAERREDSGQTQDIRNPLCSDLFGIDPTQDCVIVEMIP